jgi:hypothetical protein
VTKNEALDKAKHHAKSTRSQAYIYRLEVSVEWQWSTFNPSWMRVKQCRKVLPNGLAVKEVIA